MRYVLALVAAIAFAGVLIAQRNAGEGRADAEAPSGDVAYLDVRTPEEWRAGRVEGAILIPHDQVAARAGELEKYRDRDVVVYCRSGRRSAIAIDALQRQGFTRLTNGGGFEDLARQRRLPVATGD